MWINLNNTLINLSNIINISKSNKCEEKNKYYLESDYANREDFLKTLSRKKFKYLINFRACGIKKVFFTAYKTQEERDQEFEKILTLISNNHERE